MKRRGKKLVKVIKMLGVAAFLGVAGVQCYQPVMAEDTELDAVDLSKGIEYVYREDGTTVSYINLNGNSVIIKESPNSDEDNKYLNIYIDSNRNGVIDGEETLASIDGSTDIMSGKTIYGIREQKSTTPIRITVDSGSLASVYGVREGKIVTADETPIVLDINGGTFTGSIYGEQASEVTASNSSAIKVDVSGGTIGSYLYGSYWLNNGSYSFSKISATGADITLVDVDLTGGTIGNSVYGIANTNLTLEDTDDFLLDMDITGNVIVKKYIYGLYGYPSAISEVSGNVDVYYKPTQLSDEAVVDTFSAINTVILNGSANVYVDNVNADTIRGGYQCKIIDDFTVANGNNCISKYVYGGQYTQVLGDTDITVYGTSNDGTCDVYGLYNIFSGEKNMAGDSFDFTYKGGKARSVSVLDSEYDSLVIPCSGDVNIIFEGGILTGTITGVDSLVLKKTYTFAVTPECSITGKDAYVYPAKDSAINGDVDIDLHNNNSSDEELRFVGLSNTDVSGNVDISVEGGYYDSIKGIYSSDSTDTVTGDVVITYSDIKKCDGDFYGTEDVNVDGNLNITASDLQVYKFYGTEGTDVTKNVTIDIDNVTSSWDVYGTQVDNVGGNIICNMNNVSSGYQVYGVYQNSSSTCCGTIEVELVKTSAEAGFYGMKSDNGTVVGNVKVVLDECTGKSTSYGICGITTEKDVEVVISNGEFGGTNGNNTYGVGSCDIGGETNVDILDTSINGCLYPYQATSGATGSGDVVIDLVGVEQNNPSGSTNTDLSNTTVSGQKVTMNIDATSNIDESIKINISKNYPDDENVTLNQQPNTITGGESYEFENDTAIYKIVLDEGGMYHIPAGVTVTVNTLEFNGGTLVLEGTLNVTKITGVENNNGIYEGTALYVNGGNTISTDKIEKLYYPVSIKETTNGTVDFVNELNKTTYTGEQLFAEVGSTVSVNIKAFADYMIDKKELLVNGEIASVEWTLSGDTYSFVMPDKSCEVEVTFKILHTHSHLLKYDATNHWKECDCGEKINVAAHSYDAGTEIKPATKTETGMKQYVCIVCRYIKQEEIPVITVVPDEEEQDKVDGEKEPGEEIKNEDGDFVVADDDIDYFDGDEDLKDEEETDNTPCVVYTGPVNPNVENITVPDTIEVDGVKYKVTVIADGAFKNNKKLKKIVIGNNIKKIGNSAFYGCSKLKTVTFKKTSKVATIGKKAFYKCTALTKISIPASVKKIDDYGFYYCKKMTTVSFAAKSKLVKIGKKTFAKCTALKKIVIPDKVTTIGTSAFEGSSKMTSATIGKYVKKIGSKAFYNCKKLKTITIKTSKLTKKSIGSKAFSKAGSSYYSKVVVKVPSKKYKTYKGYLIKAGLSKKAKLKKL